MAAVIRVTTLRDVVNANDGVVSLREALAMAAKTPGDTPTITFAEKLAGGEIKLNSTLNLKSNKANATFYANINGDINGDGVADITISGDANRNGVVDEGDVRLFNIRDDATVVLDNLNLTNGFDRGVFSANPGAANAAAAVIRNSGDLTIRNTVISDSKAYGGTRTSSTQSLTNDAAIVLNEGSGTLTITDTFFDGNRSQGGQGASQYRYGDGGDAASMINRGALTITRTGFSGEAIGGTAGYNVLLSGDGGLATTGVLNLGSVAAGASIGLDPNSPAPVAGAGTTPGLLGGGYAGAALPVFANKGGGSGTATLAVSGGAGDDLITTTGATPPLAFGFGGDDTINGGNAVDTIYGGAGNDVINGGYYVDSLFGGAGNDRFVIGRYDFFDDVVGGFGTDTIDFSATALSVYANLQTGAQGSIGPNSISPRGSIAGVEIIIGSAQGDRLIGDGRANRFEGGGGVDTLEGGGGNDVLIGGAQADRINGGAGSDRIVVTGGDAQDFVDGGAGRDTLDLSGSNYGHQVNLGAGAFARLLSGGVGDTTIAGVENVIGSAQSDGLRGDAGNNQLIGLGGRDRMSGQGGDDLLRGGDDSDVLDGGGRNDQLFGGRGADILTGGAGADRLNGDQGDDALGGGLGDDRHNGGGGNDTINGGGGRDLLLGQAGNDRLFGGAGNDTLRGGSANDFLNGGGGADRFVFAPREGRDVIDGFQDGLDKILILGPVNSFAGLNVSQSGDNAVIRFSGTTVIVRDTDADDLGAADFLFG